MNNNYYPFLAFVSFDILEVTINCRSFNAELRAFKYFSFASFQIFQFVLVKIIVPKF